MHEIKIWLDETDDGQPECWCAAHRVDGEHDTSDPLPPEAQDDPESYVRQRWPNAIVTSE